MRIDRRAVAVGQMLLSLPAMLFLGAIVLRYLDLSQSESRQTAQRIIMWYSSRLWTLWVLLIALPCAVLAAGFFTLLTDGSAMECPKSARQSLAQLLTPMSNLVVAAATTMAAAMLAVIVVHMLAN